MASGATRPAGGPRRRWVAGGPRRRWVAGGPRRRWVAAALAVGVAAVHIAACAPSTAPDGFDLVGTRGAPHPDFEAVARDSPIATPVTMTTWSYAWRADPTRHLTATLGAYQSRGAALAAFNGWLARFGFLAAVDRTGVPAGEQAVRLDLGWPAMHDLIGRADDHFLLIEADEAIAPEDRAAAMTFLATRLLGPPVAWPTPAPR